jgi:hypothetical protein
VAFNGGDASTIRSLVRRGLLEYSTHVESGDGTFHEEKERPGYTLTEKSRAMLQSSTAREDGNG